MMEAAGFTETLVSARQTAWHNNQIAHCAQSLMSHTGNLEVSEQMTEGTLILIAVTDRDICCKCSAHRFHYFEILVNLLKELRKTEADVRVVDVPK
jgi:hypothetical protein